MKILKQNRNNLSRKVECNTEAVKETKRYKFWIDIAAAVGGVAQIVISVILIMTLFAYYKSNETTRETLKLTRFQLMAAQVPWITIKIDDIRLKENSLILVTSTITNNGNGPAVSLNYKISLEGTNDQFVVKPISKNQFLSPNNYQKATGRFIKENAAEIYDKILNGAVVVREMVTFNDVFGREGHLGTFYIPFVNKKFNK
jgi:hypothetical protein